MQKTIPSWRGATQGGGEQPKNVRWIEMQDLCDELVVSLHPSSPEAGLDPGGRPTLFEAMQEANITGSNIWNATLLAVAIESR